MQDVPDSALANIHRPPRPPLAPGMAGSISTAETMLGVSRSMPWLGRDPATAPIQESFRLGRAGCSSTP